jgi:hypothetical protein
MSRFTALTLAATSLALAACADSTSVTAPRTSASDVASFDASNGPFEPDIRHYFLPRQASENAASHAGGGGASTRISYHGGPILQAGTSVATIYWASNVIFNGGPAPGSTGNGSQDGSLIGEFLRGLGGSPYFKINTTYTDGGGNAIANSVSYTQFWANNSYNVPSGTASVSDAQMVAMLQYAFNNGKLAYDANTLYHIFTAGKVNLGGGFGTSYCAYHTHGTVTIGGVARTVLYSAMPYDYAYPSACSANAAAWPNDDPGADAEVNTLAHETEETATDMLGNAWFDKRGFENADKCAWQFGNTFTTANGSKANVVIGGRNWLVQMNWVNSGNGFCANSVP